VIADMARSNPPMVSAFVAELTRRLQGHGPALALPLTWIEQRLSESGLTIEQLVRSENRQQAADQVSMSNSIGSLRFLGAMDWREFVETMSIVEQTLVRIPATSTARWILPPGIATVTSWKNRQAQPALRKRGGAPGDPTGAWVRPEKGGDDRSAHVGYYLIDKGLRSLERSGQVRLSSAEAIRKAGRRIPLLLLWRRHPADDGDFAASLGEGVCRRIAGSGRSADSDCPCCCAPAIWR
jgi:cyclic beta-1,2-glucan synthetase